MVMVTYHWTIVTNLIVMIKDEIYNLKLINKLKLIIYNNNLLNYKIINNYYKKLVFSNKILRLIKEQCKFK